MSRRKLTLWQKVLVLGLAVWAFLLVAPESVRVLHDYGTLGFEADNNGKIYDVDDAGASPLGIQKGERIDLHRTSLPNRLAVFAGMGGMQYVRPDLEVQLYIVSRPDKITVKATQKDLGSLTWSALLLEYLNRVPLLLETVAGVAFIYYSGRMVWQCPNAVTWGFFLYAIWFNPGQYFVSYAELQRWPYLVIVQEILQSIAQGAGYAGFVIFALRFPRNRVDDRWRRVERAMPFVAVVLAVLQLCSFGTALGFRTETVTRLSYFAGLAVDFLVLWFLWVRQWTQAPEDRQRTRWILWLGGLGLLAFIVADSYEATSLFSRYLRVNETTLSFFYLLNAALLYAVVHAVRRHRVIDVTFAISRKITLALSSVITFVVVFGPATFIELYFGDRLAEVSGVFLLASLLLVFKYIFGLIHEWLNERIDRLFFRRLHTAEKRLRDFEATFGKAESRESVDGVLADEPVAWLDIAWAAVFRKEETATFRRVRGMGWWAENTSEIASDKPLIHELMRMKNPIRFEEGDNLLDGIPPGVAKPALAVPVIIRGDLSALALYSVHKPGDDLPEEEVAILGDFARNAAHAYERIETSELRKKVDELTIKPTWGSSDDQLLPA